MTFPESRFVKLSNPVSRSKLQSRISLPVFSKIPNPGLQKSQIPDPEKPIGDPHCKIVCISECDRVFLQLSQIFSLHNRNISGKFKSVLFISVLQMCTSQQPVVNSSDSSSLANLTNSCQICQICQTCQIRQVRQVNMGDPVFG